MWKGLTLAGRPASLKTGQKNGDLGFLNGSTQHSRCTVHKQKHANWDTDIEPI